MGNKAQKTNLNTIFVKSSGEIYDNTTENTIIINESKAKLIYNKYISKGNYGTLCLTWLGLFITCLLASLTAEFKDFFNISGSSIYLTILFVIATCVFGILVFIFFIIWLKRKKKYTEKEFLRELKNKD